MDFPSFPEGEQSLSMTTRTTVPRLRRRDTLTRGKGPNQTIRTLPGNRRRLPSLRTGSDKTAPDEDVDALPGHCQSNAEDTRTLWWKYKLPRTSSGGIGFSRFIMSWFLPQRPNRECVPANLCPPWSPPLYLLGLRRNSSQVC